jgi:hypothetical protein
MSPIRPRRRRVRRTSAVAWPRRKQRRRRGRPGRRSSRAGAAGLAVVALLGGLAACVPPAPAHPQVDLKVLVISTGDRTEDPGLELMARTLDQIGVPYDVLDSTTTDLTDGTLSTGNRGHYNGIVLTQADLFAPGGSGFTGDEWRRLHSYERTFKVREAIISGFPVTDAARDLDYGMAAAGANVSTQGRWVAPAGSGRLFNYVNTANTLPIPEYSVWATPRSGGPGPRVTPLLVDDADRSRVLVSQLDYSDGRQVLLSTVGNAWFWLHSNVLAYQFLDFATGGLFIGGRFVSLSTHTDDMFLADDLWDPATNRTSPDVSYRITPADLDAARAATTAFRAAHPLAAGWRIQLPFNGAGANALSDPLTWSALWNKNEFNWINHTYRALQMDRLCPDPDEPQPPECPVTDYQTAHDEIAVNRLVWAQLGLPGYDQGVPYLLSDSHAGLHDRRGTEEDPSDDVPFPEGLNPNFFRAAHDLGVRFVASDSSRPNQDREQRVPGFTDMVILPRYPTNVYVNATTPAENTDEYNWLYHDRFVEQGQDPCTTPGAVCAPKTYEQLLASEAETAVNHMLSGREWPHYFHQSNLRNYGGGRSLQLDWVNAVMTRYERLLTLPVKTPLAHELGPAALDRIVAAEQHVRGWLDVETGRVTLEADGEARPLVTGIAGGDRYGGESIAKVTVGTTPTAYERDTGG